MGASPAVLLAIDDDAENLSVIQNGLAQSGLQILTASDPVAGMDLVRARRPQIVLMDLTMPGTGMQMLEQVVEFDPGIDIVIMTADSSTEAGVEAIKRGACDYLDKPLSAELLRQRINKLIEVT